MQIDKLYPTDVTNPETGIALSAFTENIDGIEDSMADAYLMGYLPPEMVAPSFRPVILSGGGDSVTAIYDYSQNYGWGYIFRQGSSDGTGGVNYVNQNGVYTRLYNVNSDYRFINTAEMSKYCTDDTVTIYIAALAINKNYWDSTKMATTQMLGGYDVQLIVNTTQTYTFAQWRDIIKNDTIFYNGTAQGHTITLRPSDFGDANDPNQLHVKFFESGDYIIRADIYNYIIGATHYMNLNAGYSNYIITPFVQAKISAAGLPDTAADVIPGTNLQHYFWMRYTNGALSFERGQTTGQNNYDYIPDYNITFGGFNNGTVSVSDIDFSTASNNARLGFVRNWYFNYDNGVFRIVPTFTPLDIYHHMALYHKHTSAPSGDYSSVDTVTVFTNSNVPTLQTVSGTLSDIQLDLQPWQYPGIDITVNTFIPTDIPNSGRYSTNKIRFGNITPSEFLFGDISIEKIYFGSSLLYQKFVPEQYVRLNPADKFITEKTFADDYRVYGPLPSGEIIISVRTPRVRNLLPFPYRGFWQANSDGTWGHYTDSPGNNPTVDSSGVVSTGAGSVSLKYRMVLASNHDGSADFQPPVIVPAGTYTASIRPSYVSRSSGWRPQLEIRAYRVTDTTYELFSTITDYDGSGWSGRISFTVNEPAIIVMSVFYTSSRNFVADTLYPQLEAGSMTEFEPVNPATLTTITLPRALEENEYISYADQKIMPTGTPLVVPKLKTIVGENVIMIENYPRVTNTILLTPATKE